MNVCFNGAFLPAASPLLTVQNSSYKWGDGLFETMKVWNGRLLLQDLHFERLFTSLKLIQIDTNPTFTQDNLQQQIIELCEQNDCLAAARIRLAIFRESDNSAGYSIEAIPLDTVSNQWVDAGQSIALYPYVRKSVDAFSNLKSANYLPYVLARRHSVELGVDDAIVLNAHGFLCDSSRANLFLIKGDELLTPALHQGCINGVMRRVVLQEAKNTEWTIHQTALSEEDLVAADEVFLTNAIQVMRWVKTFRDVRYGNEKTRRLFDAVRATIFGAFC